MAAELYGLGKILDPNGLIIEALRELSHHGNKKQSVHQHRNKDHEQIEDGEQE